MRESSVFLVKWSKGAPLTWSLLFLSRSTLCSRRSSGWPTSRIQRSFATPWWPPASGQVVRSTKTGMQNLSPRPLLLGRMGGRGLLKQGRSVQRFSCHGAASQVLFADIIWSRLAIYLFMMGHLGPASRAALQSLDTWLHWAPCGAHACRPFNTPYM